MSNIYVSLDLRAKESEEALHYHVERIVRLFQRRFYHKTTRPTITIELLHVPVCYLNIKSSKEVERTFTLVGYKEFYE